jgi:hypothetical protein
MRKRWRDDTSAAASGRQKTQRFVANLIDMRRYVSTSSYADPWGCHANAFLEVTFEKRYPVIRNQRFRREAHAIPCYDSATSWMGDVGETQRSWWRLASLEAGRGVVEAMVAIRYSLEQVGREMQRTIGDGGLGDVASQVHSNVHVLPLLSHTAIFPDPRRSVTSSP